MNPRTYNTRDFLDAWFAKRRYQNAHEDLKGYHAAVYHAFSQAFGIDLEFPPTQNDPSFEKRDLHASFMMTALSLENLKSPFAGVMAGSQSFVEIYQKYRETMHEKLYDLQLVYLSILDEFIQHIWTDQCSGEVSSEQLIECGHPGWKAPDPIDYW